MPTPQYLLFRGESPVISLSTGWQYESECVPARVSACVYALLRVRESAWEFLLSPFRGVASCTAPLAEASWRGRACASLLSPRRLFGLLTSRVYPHHPTPRLHQQQQHHHHHCYTSTPSHTPTPLPPPLRKQIRDPSMPQQQLGIRLSSPKVTAGAAAGFPRPREHGDSTE